MNKICDALKTFSKFKLSIFLHQNIRPSSSLVLGIETSCDDTGCAIIDTKGNILGETLHSQHVTHLRNGGINPVFAHEFHRDNIENVVNETLKKASVKVEDLEAIAVTVKPGLLACLEVGVKFARYISKKHRKPIIPIHHMEAHALVARMYHDIKFPFIVLLVSGGHCLLALVKDVEDYLLLGQSLDDSPGEAFDKTARRMKLRNVKQYSRMSGGQAIETAALKATDPKQFEFPLPLARIRDCNFSFSGLKDSVIRKLIIKEREHNVMGDCLIPEINDLCASFQMAIAKHLVHRTERAVKFCELNNMLPIDKRTIVVSGGVACNNFIFNSLQLLGYKLGYQVYRPLPKVCTDNGVMIAWNAIEKLQNAGCKYKDIAYSDIEPKAPLGINCTVQVKESKIPVKALRLKYF